MARPNHFLSQPLTSVTTQLEILPSEKVGNVTGELTAEAVGGEVPLHQVCG